jgi:hypothetical protein
MGTFLIVRVAEIISIIFKRLTQVVKNVHLFMGQNHELIVAKGLPKKI